MLTLYVCHFAAPDTQEVTPSLNPMRDVIVSEGSPAQFRTQVSGKPQPTIQWLRDGLVIPQSADFQVEIYLNSLQYVLNNIFQHCNLSVCL
jgi:hypothetical protein